MLMRAKPLNLTDEQIDREAFLEALVVAFTEDPDEMPQRGSWGRDDEPEPDEKETAR